MACCITFPDENFLSLIILFKLSASPIKTCCYTDQLKTLQTSLGYARTFVKRCPSCYHNFANLFCQLTCSPHQSDFLKVVETEGTGKKKYITKLDYILTRDYAQGMLTSCENVQSPSSNERALNLLCGNFKSNCTVTNWLKFLGSPDLNTMVPFQITFNLTNTAQINDTKNVTYTAMNETIIPCNERVNNETEACSCVDCKSVCPPLPPLPPVTKPLMIMGIRAWYVIPACLFALFVFIFGSILIWKYFMCSDYEVDFTHKKEQSLNGFDRADETPSLTG